MYSIPVYVAVALLSVGVARYLWSRLKTTFTIVRPEEKPIAQDVYQAIEPLQDFDYATTPPMRIRPFKPKYHLTMALENMPLSELIAMDSTYLSRIHLRRQIMRDHRSETLACNLSAATATLELYTWLTTAYLPRRFPTHYTLHPTHLLNTITNEPIPLTPTSPLSALETLSAHIDTDFLVLLPQPPSPSSPETQPVYTLEAYCTTFPSGFSTLSKLSLPLAAIHAPVPGYASKLEKSMDRFFARLPVGRAVRRANWTVTTHANLFTESGTHLYASGEEGKGGEAGGLANATAKTMDLSNPNLAREIEAQKAAVRVEECRLRCERQTLHRLPESGALVFAFKTYLCTLEEVKAQGDGEALAQAIEGFGKGSVPEMEFYKRVVVWGEKVRKYLRS